MNILQFKAREYDPKMFVVVVDTKLFRVAGTLCGHIDMATPDGTWSLDPDEAFALAHALLNCREDVLANSMPFDNHPYNR